MIGGFRRHGARASETEHPELFWALRGGGGNFGVVTTFEYALHPVGPIVHMAMLFWGSQLAELTDEVIDVLVEHLPRCTSPHTIMIFYLLDGAYCAPTEDATQPHSLGIGDYVNNMVEFEPDRSWRPTDRPSTSGSAGSRADTTRTTSSGRASTSRRRASARGCGRPTRASTLAVLDLSAHPRLNRTSSTIEPAVVLQQPAEG
ncbi:MAG: hypothetical protein ACR2G2_16465 [Pseudonocardia sp.]